MSDMADLTARVRAQDFIDYPTAWAIQKAGVEHGERCSSVPGWNPISGPMFLCDCGAVEQRWVEIRLGEDTTDG